MNNTLKLSVAASAVALLAMTNEVSAGIISDQTQLVTAKGTLALLGLGRAGIGFSRRKDRTTSLQLMA